MSEVPLYKDLLGRESGPRNDGMLHRLNAFFYHFALLKVFVLHTLN